jgi:hypothetical protein
MLSSPALGGYAKLHRARRSAPPSAETEVFTFAPHSTINIRSRKVVTRGEFSSDTELTIPGRQLIGRYCGQSGHIARSEPFRAGHIPLKPVSASDVYNRVIRDSDFFKNFASCRKRGVREEI